MRTHRHSTRTHAHQQRSEIVFPRHPVVPSYPLVDVWLKTCKDDPVRGRDRSNFVVLAGVLEKRGYIRVDPVLGQLSLNDLLKFTAEDEVQVTHALAASVLLFVKEDLDKIENRDNIK